MVSQSPLSLSSPITHNIRSAFLIQVPPIVLAIVLVQWKLQLTPPKHAIVHQSKWEKLKRIDFIGAFFLCLTISSICLILDTGGQKFPWNSGVIKSMAGIGGAAAVAFVVSATLVPEPIIPLRLLGQYAVATNCIIIILLVIVQYSLMMSVPTFFQVTSKASTAAAGAYLIPAFAGNTLGGLLGGYFIKKTGLFKPLTVLAPILAVLCMTLCYLSWDERSSGWASLAIFPGGVSMGVVGSSAFVGLTAGVDEKDMAIAASAMYLFYNLGAIAAISSGGAVFETSLRKFLKQALEGRIDGPEARDYPMNSWVLS